MWESVKHILYSEAKPDLCTNTQWLLYLNLFYTDTHAQKHRVTLKSDKMNIHFLSSPYKSVFLSSLRDYSTAIEVISFP